MAEFVAEKKVFDIQPVGPLGIIAMPGCEKLADEINTYLKGWSKEEKHNETGMSENDLFTFTGYDNESYLVSVGLPRFGTGEGKGLLNGSVRGYDIYIVTDVTAYQIEYTMYGRKVPMSPDDHYADLKRIIAAIGGKAKRINVIMPFLYESRQHKRTTRESMDCAVMLQELASIGVENIITFDAHDPRVQNAIPFTGFESFQPTYQMLKALLSHVTDLQIDKEHMMVISPDEGAISRNIYYSTVLKLDMGIFIKRRDYSTVVNGRNKIISHEYIGADVSGKDVIVADDIISTGESMIDLIEDLTKRGAKRVFIAATFCFFTNGTEKFDEAFASGRLAGVMGTNLNYLPEEIQKKPWFLQADMSKYMAYIIATLNHDHSLDKLINPLERIKKLVENYLPKSEN